jgi:phospholipid/cholesterol/gamma-HCH transport system permease protein
MPSPVKEKAIILLRHLGSIWYLTLQSLYWIFVAPFKKKIFVKREHLVNQLVETGTNSVPIVFLVSFFIGMVLAMQTAYQMKQMGALMYVGALVGVSVTREIGPLLTAIVIAGRVGASITAELGTMKVSEEIDALETMGISPVRFLIAPRLLAILIMLPCLTIFSDMLAMFGGFIIGVFNLNINPQLYIAKTIDAMVLKDVFTGLIKS